jgi:hypothetical protein
VRTLTSDAGLIAATRNGEEAPSWIVTATDQRGLDLAANGFDAATLHNRFAVALTPGGALSVPQAGG